MRHVVNAAKDEFPAELQRTWLLTALTAMYLIGQLMRFDEGDRRLLLSPDAGAGDSENTMRRLRELVEDVVRYLTARHERLASSEGYDNFRVDFKRQRTLLEMASEIVLLARSRARGDEE